MSQNLLLDDLNESQQKAVQILEGPLLILAGAGSGKTKTLTHRIANLIQHGVSGSAILSVTFTNKAASEMKERITKILAKNADDIFNIKMPMMGTFHSICVRILREDIEKLDVGLSKNFVIFDTGDMHSLIKLILKERQIDDKKFKFRAILSHISKAKNQLIPPHKYWNSVDNNQFSRVVRDIYPIYQKKLTEHNALDFDDLLQKTVELLEKKPEILEKYQNRWKYVMVDEYQDTNFAQYRIIRLLTAKHENLCVVGDDHQSIYAFRGADFRNILDFEKDFPQTNVVKLEQNYRSTKNILANANALISYNVTGREKNLWTDNPQGEKVQIVETFDERAEGKFITEKIKDLARNGENYKSCAILYRMNAQSRAMEENLMRNQIPYQIIGGTRFFDRKEIKDVIAYLRLIFNPRDDVSFLRIINIPSRKLGPATLEIVKTYAQNYTMSMFEILEGIQEIPELNTKKRDTLFDFYKIIKELQEIAKKEPVSILLHRIIEKIEFLKFLEDGSEEGTSKAQNVQELFSVATRYDSAGKESLAAFLEGVALISDLDNMENQDSVTLMTVHASKGLEFPNVFLSGWEENIFPSASSQQDPRQLEEERRLGYVAITRAEKRAFISFARQRMLFGQTQSSMPSQFISQLDKNCIEQDNFVGGQTPTFSRGRNFSGSRYLSGQSYTPKTSKNFENNTDLDSMSPQLLKKQAKNKKEAIFGNAGVETEYKAGDKVVHAEHGNGTVIMVTGDVLNIAFDGQGMKKILASSSPISKI
jgi:DNA helicase-2/ATP-dependent DNA helicase PcrA